MRALKPGSEGSDVRKWQVFLVGQRLARFTPNGKFGPQTRAATIAFQRKHGLDPDGKVGNQTLGRAMALGFELVEFVGEKGSGFPKEPRFRPLVGTAARQQIFGKFSFVSTPQPDNLEAIRITGDWESENIVKVVVPQLPGIKGAPSSGTVRFHRLAAKQLQALFKAWSKAHLLDRIVTWDGSFVARFIRGSTTVLSNHAFGSAFDINAALNPLGVEPAFPGKPGCVHDLVRIAHDHGFYWGGHFASRRDGMHFEVAKVG
jgi:D-alanyl-D-alanine carboxypeptidase-like protein/putative peptidoglycan binding protein